MNPPKMPVHIGDLLRDTSHLRATGMGAYLLLLFHHWSTGGLPDDDDQLAAIARLTRGEWKKMRPIVEKFFQPGWVHGRVLDDLADAKESYEKLAAAGSKGGKARAENKRCLSVATSDGSSDAVASLKQPFTFNQERKKDAADAAPDLEVDLFRRGKEVLGKTAGGLVKQLLDAKDGKINLARAAIETAAGKENPREYIGAIIRNHDPPQGEASRYVDPRL